MWPVTGEKRVARAHSVATGVRQDLNTWFALRRSDLGLARFGSHFDLLEVILGRMLDAIGAEIAGIAPDGAPVGQVYERCRAAEYRLTVIRRMHEWYAGKYDQRLDQRWSATLAAADAVVRSCWVEVFPGRDVPPVPVAYLDQDQDAYATLRTSVPPDLRAPDDAVIGRFVRELPIPVIALPAGCVAEPWWLVLLAHETGHHVQHDVLGDAVAATDQALEVAVATATGEGELAGAWSRWAREAFADAFAVLMVGTAAAWAINELQFGSTACLVALPKAGDRYPPPAVRWALLGELARIVSLPGPGPGMAEVLRWLEGLPGDVVTPAARAKIAGHIAVTPVVAEALVELNLNGPTLRDRRATLADGGLITRWAHELVRAAPRIAGREQRWAGRVAIAGGVRAYQELAAYEPAGQLGRLRANLPAVLGDCGGTGHLAAGPRFDVDAIADRLTALLLEESTDRWSR